MDAFLNTGPYNANYAGSYAGNYTASRAGYLDTMRMNEGIDRLIDHFKEIAASDPGKAAELINEEQSGFYTLYILNPQIREYGMMQHLNTRGRQALDLMDRILNGKHNDISARARNDGEGMMTLSALKWMFVTGCPDDGLNNMFDELMELTAALLIKVFNDDSILQNVADMIYDRNRKGLLIHHLVWAFFEARNPLSLTLLAVHLLSAEEDVVLTRKLLGFIPGIDEDIDRLRLYDNTVNWINGNCIFLRYTGESMHQSDRPIHYELCTEAKYLCKPVSVKDGEPVEPFTAEEKGLLEELKSLDDENVKLLADCSLLLCRRNPGWRRIWLYYPITMRIDIARNLTKGDPL